MHAVLTIHKTFVRTLEESPHRPAFGPPECLLLKIPTTWKNPRMREDFLVKELKRMLLGRAMFCFHHFFLSFFLVYKTPLLNLCFISFSFVYKLNSCGFLKLQN